MEMSGNYGKTITSVIDDATLRCTTSFSDRFVFSNNFIPLVVKFDGSTPPTDDLSYLLKSELGYLFLDRTRLRPNGIAIGENVYSLSLAPAEEVVLEQKNFSKRQSTYEEQTEQEKQFDLELSSTLSTELQEGFQAQKNLSSTSGFSIGGGVNGEVEGVPVNINASYTNNVAEANSQTKTRSIKESYTTASKVASKYRTLHKTTFKVSTEVGFETASKRTIRNPNKCTPIQLHFFKILRSVQMIQERYGVRLCWATTIKDPGFDFAERIRIGREGIIARELQSIEIPPQPVLQTTGVPKTFETSPLVDTSSKWGVTCDMSANFDVPIPIGSGYSWNNDTEYVKNSVELSADKVNRGYGFGIIGNPWQDADNTVKVQVHVGVDWIRGLPIGGCGKIYIKAKAVGIPTPTPEQYEEWKAKMKEWQETVNSLTQEAKDRGQSKADAWEQEVMAKLNPVEEIMQRVAKTYIPQGMSDEMWEIDFWQTVFDWDSASYLLYPGWWSPKPMRDYTKDPNYFLNASWAKLYLPVKIGNEAKALRWIFGNSMKPLASNQEGVFSNIIKDLESFRSSYFGPSETNIVSGTGGSNDTLNEKYIVLGQWTELIPTDGTHLEVIQSMTSACDQYSKDEITDNRNLKLVMTDSQQQDVQIKKSLPTMVKSNVTANINLNVDGDANTEK
jgi:hypothetical protein